MVAVVAGAAFLEDAAREPHGDACHAGCGAPAVAVGPDGVWVLYLRTVRRLDAATGEEPLRVTVPPQRGGDRRYLALAPGGGAWVAGDGEVVRLTADGGRPRSVLLRPRSSTTSLAVSGAAAWLGTGRRVVRVTETGRQRVVLRTRTPRPRVHADAGLVWVVERDGTARGLDPRSGTVRAGPLPTGGVDTAVGAVVSPIANVSGATPRSSDVRAVVGGEGVVAVAMADPPRVVVLDAETREVRWESRVPAR